MKMGGQEFKGVETVRSFGNGLWIVFDFHCDNFMGMPFDGHGTAGYSPDEKKYVLNWIDSMSTDVDSGTGVSTMAARRSTGPPRRATRSRASWSRRSASRRPRTTTTTR
jgi:hypothetical protein